MRVTAASAVLTLLTLTVGLAPAIAHADTTQAPAAAEKVGPKAVPVEAVQDAGTVPKGEKIKTIFEIRNEGDAVLEITDVRPSCGCTVATYDDKIAPGEVGRIHVVIDSTNLFGADVKKVTVLTNDPSNPSIVLSIKSMVRPYLNAVPGYARFNVVQGEASGSVTQSIWAEDGEPFKILSVEAPEGPFKASFREATEEERVEGAKGKQYMVDLTIDTNGHLGPITGGLLVTTDHPKQKAMRIPVSGFIRPILAVTPQTANFRKIELKEPLRANLLIKNYATEEIQLTNITSSMPTVTAEIIPLEAGRRYQIKLTLSPDTPKGELDGKLTITTDSPKVPTLEIPVIGTVI